MVRRQTIVQFDEAQLALLDAGAAKRRVSRSQLVREAVDAFLSDDREAEIGRQIVDGYTRMPQGGEFDLDEWGDLGEFNEFHAREGIRALAEEERAAGHPPW